MPHEPWNTNLSWKFRELIECVNDPKIKERLKLFCNSLHYKLEFTDRHASLCQEFFDTFHAKPIVVLGGGEFNRLFFEFESHLLAYLFILHTTADTFAQILNILLLSPPLNEADVDIKRIKRTLEEQNLYPCWQCEIEELVALDEFKYVEGFVNISKHRHLLKQSYKTEWKEGDSTITGFKIESFQFRGMNFESRWAKDIIEMRGAIRYHLVRMGNELNKQFISSHAA